MSKDRNHILSGKILSEYSIDLPFHFWCIISSFLAIEIIGYSHDVVMDHILVLCRMNIEGQLDEMVLFENLELATCAMSLIE